MTRFVEPRPYTAALLASVLAVTLAQAQTAAPAKSTRPAAAAEGKTLSLGSGKGTGRLLTRDELRSCLQRQDSLATSRAAVEAERGPMDADKQALLSEQEALKAEHDKVDAVSQQVSQLNARFKAYSERVAAWNERAKLTANDSGPHADRERRALDKERDDLQTLQKQLDADRAKLGDNAQQTVNAYNTRAQALAQRVADWNERNKALSERTRTLNDKREAWVNDCADRRYREDDETAIKRGE